LYTLIANAAQITEQLKLIVNKCSSMHKAMSHYITFAVAQLTLV